MANRPNSSGPDSSAGSTTDIPTGLGAYKLGVLPEEWTLPYEWKIEKRELFDNWKMDVQNQISNISRNLNSSLQTYPHPEVGAELRSTATLLAEWELESQMLKQKRKDDRGMQLGLSRNIREA